MFLYLAHIRTPEERLSTIGCLNSTATDEFVCVDIEFFDVLTLLQVEFLLIHFTRFVNRCYMLNDLTRLIP